MPVASLLPYLIGLAVSAYLTFEHCSAPATSASPWTTPVRTAAVVLLAEATAEPFTSPADPT
ncbi:MAG: hypothetical protein ACXV4A_10560 [Actinomycetes bacterium]